MELLKVDLKSKKKYYVYTPYNYEVVLFTKYVGKTQGTL